MTKEEARQELMELNHAISTCVTLLRSYLPLMEQFERERRDMESFGHILDPTLYMSSERQAVSALMHQLYQAAATLLKTYDETLTKTRAAMEQAK